MNQNENIQKPIKLKKIKIIFYILFIIGLISIITILLIDMRFAIKEAFKTWSYTPLEKKFFEYRDKNSLLGYLVITLTQTMMMLFMLPGEGIEVISTICYGKLIAFTACLLGIIIGNTIMYILVRKIGKSIIYLFKKKHQNTLNEIEQTKRISTSRVTIGVSILYFIPGIPYGIIAIAASSTKMKFLRYFIITTICSAPSIILSVLFGSVVTEGNTFWVIFIIIVMIIATILSIIFKDKMINFFTKKETKGDITYFKSNPGHINNFIYYLINLISKFFQKKYKLKVTNNIENIESPFILLHNHVTFYDFMWVQMPLYPKKTHTVMSYEYFTKSMNGRLFHNKMGCFPKMLFEPDLSCFKNIKRTIKNNCNLTLAPEGRLSLDGTLEKIASSTAKFIKSLNSNVVFCKLNGAYLSMPKWAKKFRIGEIEATYDVLFTKEELNTLSNDDIYDRLYEKMNYDDFKWQKDKKIKFKCSKMAEGLEQICYICPKCHKEHTLKTKKDTIYCQECDFELKIDNYYNFTSSFKDAPLSIPQWIQFQKDIESKKISDPNFSLSSDVILKMPHPDGKGMKTVGSGTIKMTQEGILYTGTINNENKAIQFSVETLPALPFSCGKDIDIYKENSYYQFFLSQKNDAAKWSLVWELIYNKYIKDNNINIIK